MMVRIALNPGVLVDGFDRVGSISNSCTTTANGLQCIAP
jgi:hypothetical protein